MHFDGVCRGLLVFCSFLFCLHTVMAHIQRSPLWIYLISKHCISQPISLLGFLPPQIGNACMVRLPRIRQQERYWFISRRRSVHKHRVIVVERPLRQSANWLKQWISDTLCIWGKTYRLLVFLLLFLIASQKFGKVLQLKKWKEYVLYIGKLVLHCYYKTKPPNFSKRLTLMLIRDISGEFVFLFC